MNAPAWKNRLGTAILACLLAAGSSAAHAQDQDAGRPLLLIASPAVQGPYQQTTLLVVPAGDKHVGFILNRATDVKLSALFPGHVPSAAVADPVYIGGPEMNESLFAIVRRKPSGPSMQLFGELFVTGHAETINQIIEHAPNDARFFAGFVGWSTGELENEIARGVWYLAEPDPGIVLRSDTSSMWRELVQRHGVKPQPQRDRNMIDAGYLPQM